IDTGECFRLDKIRSFIVTYANGEIVDAENTFAPWPKDVHSIQPASQPINDILNLHHLESGQRFAQVTHGQSIIKKADKYYYSTTLHNISEQRIRVLKFAGYQHISGNQYRLDTITQDYFTAEEFRSWYGMGQEEWIQPGQMVTDKENYGGRGSLWAYFCCSETGEEFIVGEIVT
ncbi:MAG TPA: hypothetical protein VHV83_03365, partial [Armatimonadota bacterium]|nr:hypothetical protein [Armatimonadota bacterium]